MGTVRWNYENLPFIAWDWESLVLGRWGSHFPALEALNECLPWRNGRMFLLGQCSLVLPIWQDCFWHYQLTVLIFLDSAEPCFPSHSSKWLLSLSPCCCCERAVSWQFCCAISVGTNSDFKPPPLPVLSNRIPCHLTCQSLQPRRWKQQVPPKHWYPLTVLYNVTIWAVTAVKTWELPTVCVILSWY